MADFEPIRFGKYQLIEKIATGGMAEVYKAKSYGVAGFEKLLVIKKILPHLSRNPEFVRMFINEAKIAVSLNHANIVQVYDLGVVGEDYYMAMEFIHGQDLMRIIKLGRKTRRFLPIPTGVYIITEVARGLDYAHNLTDPGGRPLNVVHQDVSPHNILISYEGDVKLVDFGIARVGEVVEEEKGKMAGGKFAYMSPEQATGGSVDARSDIFACGIILYESITGQRLYAGKDRQEKMRMVRNAEIPPPRAVNPEIPARLEEIALKALHRDPDQRYQRARDLQEDLLSFLYDVGMRVTRADLAHFQKEMFAEEYQRASAGSVVNAIAKDIDELNQQPVIVPDLTIDDALGKADESEGALVSGEWQPIDLSYSFSNRTGSTPGLGTAPMAQGDRRQVEVLAVEITGLTDIAERVGEELLLRLNFSFLKSLATVIKKYRGTIARLDADRLLIFWGLEDPTSKDLELCLRCASDLRRISEKFAEAKGEQVHLSMGVHRGAVLVAGGKKKKRKRRHRGYTPWGDTVKQARRLCEAAGLDEVLVSEKVWGLTSEWGEFDELPEVGVKWASQTIRPYRLKRLRGRGERGSAGRWVKRGDEFEILLGMIKRVAQSRAAVLSLEGDAGSGRARFLREIREITREQEIAFYSGRGYFYRRETPFLPFREVLEQVCGFEEDDPEELRREKLLRLAELRLDPIDIHIIGQLFELEFENSNLKYLSGDQKRIGVFEAIRKVFAGLCDDGFLVIALENFQFVDHYTGELALHLMRTLGDRKLLLVVTQPPNGELPFDDDAVVRLPMPPMKLEEVRRFTAEILGVAEIPEPLEELVYESSGGNALFVKEIVGQLRRQGIVQIQSGEVVLKGNLDEAGIPASVEDLIGSRISSLSSGERVVVEVAATIGRSFERRLLQETTQLDPERLTEVLARLQALKLVRPMRAEEQSAEADYTFRNNLCWEVTTRGILAGRAKEFHVRIGEAIERQHEDQLRPHYESLSRHYQAGGLLRRAAGFAEQAGIAYDRGYFNREALRCFQRAILLLRGAEAQQGEARETAAHLAELYLRIGDIRGRDVAFKEAERNYAKALDFAGEADDEKLETKALIKLGHARVELGKLDAAGSFLARAQEMAELMDDEALRTDADEEVAGWALKKGDFASARRALTRALETARANDDKIRVARILGSLGSYYMRSGQYPLSERHLNQAREIAMETDDKVLQGKLLNNLGVTFIHMEKFREALDCYRQACEIRQGIEYRRGVIVNLHNIGDVYFRMGDYARAFQYFEESLAAADANDWELGRAMNLVYLGYLQALRGEIEEGEEALTSGIARAQKAGDKEIASQGKVFLARVYTRRGEVHKARELLADADGMQPIPIPEVDEATATMQAPV